MNENKLEDSKGFAALLRLVRPKQWIKNGFIFLPLFFGGALLHTDALMAGLITFFAYSFAASSIIVSTISLMWRPTAATRSSAIVR